VDLRQIRIHGQTRRPLKSMSETGISELRLSLLGVEALESLLVELKSPIERLLRGVGLILASQNILVSLFFRRILELKIRGDVIKIQAAPLNWRLEQCLLAWRSFLIEFGPPEPLIDSLALDAFIAVINRLVDRGERCRMKFGLLFGFAE